MLYLCYSCKLTETLKYISEIFLFSLWKSYNSAGSTRHILARPAAIFLPFGTGIHYLPPFKSFSRTFSAPTTILTQICPPLSPYSCGLPTTVHSKIISESPPRDALSGYACARMEDTKKPPCAKSGAGRVACLYAIVRALIPAPARTGREPPAFCRRTPPSGIPPRG